ncbi:asparagine synthase C-terminal domain-containing protein [Hyphomonas sp.]|uniref:asparagine synthase-related protein n=1 Tax=Hyphomonas sp. TaxID=87 RepID=UPI0025BF5D8A|nr:asparagine synthase C-terminal domain-containing protein [Hyphomonas sp.]
MSAFIALIWDPECPEALDEARGLIEEPSRQPPMTFRSDVAGLYVADLSAPLARAQLLALGGAGAVFGHLFTRSGTLRPAACLQQVPPDAAAAIRASSGRRLLTDFWGSYVAFVRHEDTLTVLADPASSIPCFYTRRGRVTCVFSHLERCPRAWRRGLSINRAFVSQLLAYDKIQNGAAGLNEVRELQAGFCLAVSGSGSEACLAWDPRELGRQPDRRPAAEAADELRATLRFVVQSHALSLPSTALNLSGGLDSAILAAMLSDGGQPLDVEGVHFVLGGGDPAETEYARSVAAVLGLRLIERAVDPARGLPSPEQYPPTARPYRDFLGLAAPDAGAAPGGRVVFTGQGGDHLFLETRSPLLFADYLRRCGPGRETLRVLQDAARLSGLSVWQVLREVLPVAARGEEDARARLAGLTDRQTRINRHAHAGLDPAELLPAWARRPDGVAPAKFRQIISLVHMAQIRNALPATGAAPLVHPLMSQPLIELCLRLPADLLCTGGRPRGLARLAMKGLLPDAVRLRQSKGDASRFFVQQITASQALISETLRDGELVSSGYVERQDIDACLTPDAYRTQTFGRMILVYYVIECWLRRWRTELGAR